MFIQFIDIFLQKVWHFKTVVGLLVHRKQRMWTFQNKFTWENKVNISATIKQMEKQKHMLKLWLWHYNYSFFQQYVIKLPRYYAKELNLFSSILSSYFHWLKKQNKTKLWGKHGEVLFKSTMFTNVSKKVMSGSGLHSQDPWQQWRPPLNVPRAAPQMLPTVTDLLRSFVLPFSYIIW